MTAAAPRARWIPSGVNPVSLGAHCFVVAVGATLALISPPWPPGVVITVMGSVAVGAAYAVGFVRRSTGRRFADGQYHVAGRPLATLALRLGHEFTHFEGLMESDRPTGRHHRTDED